ncbi:LOW QUALITY PROTEIN: hypothetical protein HMPREF0101_02544, partial [Bacteroides fragilis]
REIVCENGLRDTSGGSGGTFLKNSRHFFCLQASPVSLPPARGFSSFRMRVKVCF